MEGFKFPSTTFCKVCWWVTTCHYMSLSVLVGHYMSLSVSPPSQQTDLMERVLEKLYNRNLPIVCHCNSINTQHTINSK